MEKVLSDQGEFLRTGFTTGACATAAAKHALQSLNCDAPTFEWTKITISAPDGGNLPEIDVILIEKKLNYAKAMVVKDAGDDYDVTDGLEIFAEVTLTPEIGRISIDGGEGVGRVTKPGLQVPVGAPAINPKPLQMLENNLRPLMSQNFGISVVISAPKGVLLAEKTFNPKLGIVGGISIIGTTGIVRPMSEDAFKRSIYVELEQKKHLGVQRLVLVPGKHGENFAVNQLHFDPDQIVHMSNFVGFCVSSAEKLGFEEITLIGHIGKLVKVAGGVFNTHSKVADARRETIITHLALLRAPYDLIKTIYKANTTDEISDLLIDTPYANVFQNIAENAVSQIKAYTSTLQNVEVILYDMKLRCLADTRNQRHS